MWIHESIFIFLKISALAIKRKRLIPQINTTDDQGNWWEGRHFNLETMKLFTMSVIKALLRNAPSFSEESVGWLNKGENIPSKLKVWRAESRWRTRRMWNSCLCTTRAPTRLGGGPWTPKGAGGTPSDRLAGSWFPGSRSSPSSCGGSSKSKLLD